MAFRRTPVNNKTFDKVSDTSCLAVVHRAAPNGLSKSLSLFVIFDASRDILMTLFATLLLSVDMSENACPSLGLN